MTDGIICPFIEYLSFNNNFNNNKRYIDTNVLYATIPVITLTFILQKLTI